MGELKPGSLNTTSLSTETYSDPTSGTDFYDGSYQAVDGATGNESSFMVDFEKWHGFYLDVPIFAEAIDVISTWIIGEGFIPDDEKNAAKIKNITGFGKEDFDTIIENATRVMLSCGDSFAEEMRDKAQRLTNLKPLNPGKIKIIANPQGIIDRYEQNFGGKTIKIAIKKIFHLCWNRFADEIHGKPYAERVEPIIKQIKQLTEDLGLRFHRIVRPLRLFESESDDETEIATQTAKLKTAYKNCEIVVVPKKTLQEVEQKMQISAQDAIEYLNVLLREFVTSIGVPEVVMGWAENSSEATSKVVSLNYETKIKRIQNYIKNQIRLQLGIEGHFELSSTLEPQMTTPGVTGTLGSGVETPKVNAPSDERRGKQITKK